MTLENLLAIQKLQAFEPSAACVEQATYLLAHTESWLKANRPDLLGAVD